MRIYGVRYSYGGSLDMGMAYVLAASPEQAIETLLKEYSTFQSPFVVCEIDTDTPRVLSIGTEQGVFSTTQN